MCRAALTIGIVLVIILVAVARGQGELFPVAYLPIIMSHDPPTPTPTPKPPEIPVNGDFEQGEVGWAIVPPTPSIIRRVGVNVFTPAHSGEWLAWLGGRFDVTTSISQLINVPAARPFLSYWYKIGSLDSCGNDAGGVIVEEKGKSEVVDAFWLCSATSTSGWGRRIVNLSAYAGRAVRLTHLATTDPAKNSNLFLDDITFIAQSQSNVVEEDARKLIEGQMPK